MSGMWYDGDHEREKDKLLQACPSEQGIWRWDEAVHDRDYRKKFFFQYKNVVLRDIMLHVDDNKTNNKQ